MKYAFAATLGLASLALALDGQIGIHDPSTIALCGGKFYIRNQSMLMCYNVKA